MEMLVVLVLASLMLLLIPPLFSGSVGRVSMNTQVDRISVSLRRARSQAIASAEPVPWILDVEDNFFQIGSSGRQRTIDRNITLSLTTARSEVQTEDKIAAIRFYPDGGATGGQITLQQLENKKTISVDWLTGQINVE